jgi:segregation and condensation protein B
LETLSIIAYKQPVTKSEIESIRGVSSDYAIQKLLEKDLIVITGRNEKLPGHPLVYATSKNFMDYFGLNTAEDLPKLKEIYDENYVAPTIIGEESATAELEAAAEEPAAGAPDPDMHEPSSNGVGHNEIDMVVEEPEAGDEEVTEDGEATDAASEEEIDDIELSEEEDEEKEMDELDAAFSEEEAEETEKVDDSTYVVGQDGELIEENAPTQNDEPSGDDADNEDKTDEEKE